MHRQHISPHINHLEILSETSTHILFKRHFNLMDISEIGFLGLVQRCMVCNEASTFQGIEIVRIRLKEIWLNFFIFLFKLLSNFSFLLQFGGVYLPCTPLVYWPYIVKALRKVGRSLKTPDCPREGP